MLVGNLNFDLIVAIPMGHSIVDNIMFGACLMMTSYMEMLGNLVLLDLQDFDVIGDGLKMKKWEKLQGGVKKACFSISHDHAKFSHSHAK